MKALLSNYMLASVTIGGVVIIATVIVGYHFLHNPSPTNTTQTSAQTSKIVTNPLAQYDGTYTGTSNANQGLTAVTANIANGKVSGSATYSGAGGVKIGLAVIGNVDASGNVAGSFSGTGSAEGQSATVSGTYTGKITGNTFNVNYSGSGAGESASGSIVLTK